MATITEDYVSFETAKLLKEKGFNESIRCWYDNFQDFHEEGVRMCNTDCLPPTIMCPTLQMAMKWFLKKHNIFICVLFLEESNGFGYTIENIITKKYIATSKNSSYKEPEQAAEAAIKYCLENLI